MTGSRLRSFRFALKNRGRVLSLGDADVGLVEPPVRSPKELAGHVGLVARLVEVSGCAAGLDVLKF